MLLFTAFFVFLSAYAVGKLKESFRFSL